MSGKVQLGHRQKRGSFNL